MVICPALSETIPDKARQRILLSPCYPGSSNQTELQDVTKVLTQRSIDAAKPPQQGRTTKADGIVPGMRFIVHAGGKKSSRLLARINGKQENLDVGDLSLMTLADARTKAKRMLAMIANGEDPRTAKREAIKAASETVEIAARRFIERHAKVHNRTWRETEQRIEREILPHWGKRPLASIEQADVVALLDAIVDRGGAGISANRTLAHGRKFFNWCRERGLIKASPFNHVRPPVPEVKRDRVDTLPELALILRATDQLGYPFGPCIKLALLLGQRREEIAGMRWSELDANLRLWTLPAARAKNAVQHQVPIVPQVRSIPSVCHASPAVISCSHRPARLNQRLLQGQGCPRQGHHRAE